MRLRRNANDSIYLSEALVTNIMSEETVFETEIVLHTDFGGFSFDDEMALWLFENRGWISIKHDDYDYKKKAELPITTLIDMGHDMHCGVDNESFKLRTHKDVIDCVRAIKERHKDDPSNVSYHSHIRKLSIRRISIVVGLENYYDGRERVTYSCDDSEVRA